ncbi:Cytochrome c oxidase subunit 4 [Coemansia sp. RSA 1933]|nr:Cytochrome c oxidase subunit 4 [Coemansia sp. RSA 1933]
MMQRPIEIDLADWPDYMSLDGHGVASVAGTEYSSSAAAASGSRVRRGSFNRSKYARQPENFSEGMRQAYTSLRSNMGSAMQTILAIPVVVQESTTGEGEDEYGGNGAASGRSPVHGSVKAVVRAVPVAVLKPMIGATEAVSKTLLGLRNTMEPARRGQLEDKYKSRSLGAKKSYPSIEIMFSIVRRGLVSNSARMYAASRMTKRGFSVASVRFSDDGHEKVPMNLGPGAAADQVPTNFEQATGAERAEHLAAMEGKEYYDLNPLVLHKKGTKADPTIVPSGAASRIVGCNGAPNEEHELLWILIERYRGITRCPECGNAYKLSEEGFDPNKLNPIKHSEYEGF